MRGCLERKAAPSKATKSWCLFRASGAAYLRSNRAAPMTQPLCANAHGFSLHAGVRCAADQRSELEHLCRYITRPAIANERLSVNHAGQVVLKLKTPYRDGTSHLVMSPLEFMQRLAATHRVTITRLEQAAANAGAQHALAHLGLHLVNSGRSQAGPLAPTCVPAASCREQ